MTDTNCTFQNWFLQRSRLEIPEFASKRLKIVAGLPILKYTDDVATLVEEFEQRLGLSGRARVDLPHFAFSVSYAIDYLVTWNCAHIANGEVIRRLMLATKELDRFCPVILTPNELIDSAERGNP